MSKILLLEDDISLVDGLKYSLKKNGFDVEVARNVCEAIKYLAEISKYDLLGRNRSEFYPHGRASEAVR